MALRGKTIGQSTSSGPPISMGVDKDGNPFGKRMRVIEVNAA